MLDYTYDFIFNQLVPQANMKYITLSVLIFSFVGINALMVEEHPKCPSGHYNHARVGTWVEPPTFRKPAGWLPHMIFYFPDPLGLNQCFINDVNIPGTEMERLQRCMLNSGSDDVVAFTSCMSNTSMPAIDLCSFTLNSFQCNLNFIMKKCPTSAFAYQQINYYTVRGCDSTFTIPGFPSEITSSSENNRLSILAISLTVVVSLLKHIL